VWSGKRFRWRFCLQPEILLVQLAVREPRRRAGCMVVAHVFNLIPTAMTSLKIIKRECHKKTQWHTTNLSAR